MRISDITRRFSLYTLLAFTLFSCYDNKIIHEWTPTFDDNSSEPFGCQLMDNNLSVLFKENNLHYQTKILAEPKETLDQEGDQLWTDLDNIYLDSEMINILWNRIGKGYSTIIATETFNGHIQTTADNFNFSRFLKEVNTQDKYEVSVIVDEMTGKDYSFPKQLCVKRFLNESEMRNMGEEERQVIARADGQPIAIRYRSYNGACILVISTPLLFTNYGLLHENNAELLVDLIKQAGIKNGLTRIFYKQKQIDSNRYKGDILSTSSDFSILNDLFKALATKIAIILGILIFILFLLFSAKRRQRIIPVRQAPYNKTLDFIRQVSKLYFWRNDYSNMTRKKIVYFFAFINERLHIRMDDESLLSDNCSILSSVSGLPKDSIEKLTKKLLSIHLHNEEVNEQDMTLCIDQMNAILKKLM